MRRFLKIQSIAWLGPAMNPSSDIVLCTSAIPFGTRIHTSGPAQKGRAQPTPGMPSRGVARSCAATSTPAHAESSARSWCMAMPVCAYSCVIDAINTAVVNAEVRAPMCGPGDVRAEPDRGDMRSPERGRARSQDSTYQAVLRGDQPPWRGTCARRIFVCPVPGLLVTAPRRTWRRPDLGKAVAAARLPVLCFSTRGVAVKDHLFDDNLAGAGAAAGGRRPA